MDIVIDSSVILAIVINETHKLQIITLTTGAQLIAPPSIHWEIGNAFSAMFKRGRITLPQAVSAITAYQRISITFSDVDITDALALAHSLNIYAYDAYLIQCALKHGCPLLTLDNGLRHAARQVGITDVEIVP